ncbi:MAG: hypothetical protein IPM51_00185 [Sphingobacteriaceae bacterium]|nr:hypothetical protein [Sphingobacteriaceae bacterium]
MMIGVTPEILYKDICIELFNEIASRNLVNESAEFLLSVSSSIPWTEYTLYWLYLTEKDLIHKTYSFSNSILYHGFWTKEDFGGDRKRSIRSVLRKSDARFLIIQSTIHIYPKRIAALIFHTSKFISYSKYYFHSLIFSIKKLYLFWSEDKLKLTFQMKYRSKFKPK